MENRFNLFISILLFLIIVYVTRIGLSISEPTETDIGILDDYSNVNEDFEIWDILLDLGDFIFLQIENAPFWINFFMGLLAVIIYLTLTIIGVTLARELIGFT